MRSYTVEDLTISSIAKQSIQRNFRQSAINRIELTYEEVNINILLLEIMDEIRPLPSENNFTTI